jgi:hypothetical protein
MNLLPAPNADPFSTGGYNFVQQAPFTQNRTLVRQVRYDGRTGKVTIRFDNEAFRETGSDEVATDSREG